MRMEIQTLERLDYQLRGVEQRLTKINTKKVQAENEERAHRFEECRRMLQEKKLELLESVQVIYDLIPYSECKRMKFSQTEVAGCPKQQGTGKRLFRITSHGPQFGDAFLSPEQFIEHHLFWEYCKLALAAAHEYLTVAVPSLERELPRLETLLAGARELATAARIHE